MFCSRLSVKSAAEVEKNNLLKGEKHSARLQLKQQQVETKILGADFSLKSLQMSYFV